MASPGNGIVRSVTVVQTITAPSARIVLCTTGLGTVSSIHSTVELVISTL